MKLKDALLHIDSHPIMNDDEDFLVAWKAVTGKMDQMEAEIESLKKQLRDKMIELLPSKNDRR